MRQMKCVPDKAAREVSVKYAHFKSTADGGFRYQSVRTHLEETAVFSERFAAKTGMRETGRLLGILHDSGKFSDAYQDYLHACMRYEAGDGRAAWITGASARFM